VNWLAPDNKIRLYLLNVDHPEGGTKASFFLGRGFSSIDWRLLAHALEKHPIDNGIASTESNEWGQKLIVMCTIRTPDGTNPCIKSVWQLEDDATARLITAYPAR
jgi:hypothetical protein